MEDEIFLNYKDEFIEIYQDKKNRYNKTFKAIEIESKNKVLLKVYDKSLIEKGPKNFILKQIKREEKLTQKCISENIVKLYKKKLETEKSFIFVYELCDKNLSKYLKENGELMKKPKIFLKIIRSIAKALKVLKENKVIHRDIKPYNIFIQEIDKESTNHNEENVIFKLGDFSASISIDENDFKQIGTILYTSPEIIKNLKYNEQCDMWSLGITLYHIYFGFSPYGLDYDLESIQDLIYSDNFIFKFSGNPIFDILLKKLLTIEPEKRMTHEEFYDYVFSNEFEYGICGDIKSDIIIEDEIKNKYKKDYEEIKNIMNSKEYKQLEEITKISLESNDPKEAKKNKMYKITKIVSSPHALDLMLSLNEEIQQNENKDYINII